MINLPSSSLLPTPITAPAKCFKCRAPIEGNGFRCSNCSALYCASCAASLKQSRACTFCKSAIASETSEPTTASPTSQIPQQNISQQQSPAQQPTAGVASLVPLEVPFSSRCVRCGIVISTGKAFRCSVCSATYDEHCVSLMRQNGLCFFCKSKIVSFPTVQSSGSNVRPPTPFSSSSMRSTPAQPRVLPERQRQTGADSTSLSRKLHDFAAKIRQRFSRLRNQIGGRLSRNTSR